MAITLKLKRILFLLTTISSPLLADSQSAKHRFFIELEYRNLEIRGVNEQNAFIEKTLVNGIYTLKDKHNKFISFITESGMLQGDSHGFEVVSLNLKEPSRRSMTQLELSQFQAEVMRNLDYSQFIKLTYGTGGNRKILLRSAVDCPACGNLEKELRKHSRTTDTTFYLMPTSLMPPYESEGYRYVSYIWCSPNPSQAWKDYWAEAAFKHNDCDMSPQASAERDHNLREILSAVGIFKRSSVPKIITEDGTESTPPSRDLTRAKISAAFGSAGAPYLPPPSKWLENESELDSILTATDKAQAPAEKPKNKFGAFINKLIGPVRVSSDDMNK